MLIELFLINLHKSNGDEESSINISFNGGDSLHYAVVKMDKNRINLKKELS